MSTKMPPAVGRISSGAVGDARVDFFRTDHLQADLKGRSVRGGVITVGAQAVKFVLLLIQTMILARLLTPADFGLVAMVAPVTGFVGLFKDLGLSMATVQRQEVNHDQVSTLFWINVAASLVLMLITIAFAPVVGWFYGEPRATAITIALGALFIFGGVTAQHEALMKRQMRFTALAAKDVIGMAFGLVAAVVAALLGAGYWSLVIFTAVQAAAQMLVAWIVSGWRPGLPRRGSGLRDMLAFGGFLSGASVLAYVRRNSDNVLLGVACGAGPLGLYEKAYSILMLPMSQINGPFNSVVVPALSRLQNQPEQYRRFYCHALAILVSLGMPLAVFSIATAEPMVSLFLGEQWLDAVPIVIALAPAAFVGTFNVAGGWVYLSLGRTRRMFRVNCCTTFLVLSSFLIGLSWGPIGVAIAFSVVLSLTRIPVLLYAFKNTPIKLRDVIVVLWRPAAASFVGVLALYALSATVDLKDCSPGIIVGITGGLFWLSYLLCHVLLPGGRVNVFHIRNAVRLVRRGSVIGEAARFFQ